MFQQFVTNLADFWQNNSIFIQKNRPFKKKSVEKVYVLTIAKDREFTDFQQNNVFMQKKMCI